MSRPAPRRDAPAGRGASNEWLPDFCHPAVLFAVAVIAELVALVIVLAPGDGRSPLWPRLTTTSLMAVWIALLCAGLLCAAKRLLLKLPPSLAITLAYASVLAITFGASWTVFAIDHSLGLGLTSTYDLRQRFVLGNVAVCALVAAAGMRYFYIQEQWRQQVRAHEKAQFEALQARIRPHFLFNTLNTVASLVHRDAARAEDAIIDLADLFRSALSTADTPNTLGRELEIVQRYLSIEQLRLGARLRTRIDLDDVPMALRLPPLTLQPLVENAVYHGIQRLDEGGEVRIEGRLEDDMIRLSVFNPCPAEPGPGGHGIALANIRARLGFAFGTAARLEVEKSSGAYAVHVWLPKGGPSMMPGPVPD